MRDNRSKKLLILLTFFVFLIIFESMLNVYMSGILWIILVTFGIYVLSDELKMLKSKK